MKKVVMFFRGGLFPVNMGSRRYMAGLAGYLNSCPDIDLKLVCMGGCPRPEERDRYLKIAKSVEWISAPRRFGLFDVLNKVFSRLGVDMLNSFFTALAVRKRFMASCADADKVIVNYAVWYPLMPRRFRREKCAVITHDLVYYRRASFGGTETWWKRFKVLANRLIELRVLASYARIGVLGDYEKSELINRGVDERNIIHTGFPMEVGEVYQPQMKKYDFVFVGGGVGGAPVLSLEMFFRRVAGIISGRKISVAVTRAETWNWDAIHIPPNVELIKFGFVENLGKLLSETRIGIGTIPVGSGVKTKVMEMMMNNMLVVATDHAIEGIPADGRAYINIDHSSDSDIRNWIIDVLNDDRCMYEIGRQNGTRIREAFAPENCLKGVVDWIEER